MKKMLKITGICLAVFALAMNLHSALFTFYGIKTNALSGQVWAQSTSTDGGTSTSNFIWSSQTDGCTQSYVVLIPVTTNGSGAGSASVGLTGNTVSSASLSGSGSAATTNQYIAILTPGSVVTCPLGAGFCGSHTCTYPVGTKPSLIVVNGKQIPITSWGTSASN